MIDWREIAKIDASRSFLERICWPYDKYPDMPELKSGTEIVLLDADGPGVVTHIHSSRMDDREAVLFGREIQEADAYSRVTIEITYDFHEVPDISMPLGAFLGDPDGLCGLYQTRYFSKVRFAHNFRLPLPFQKHIRVALKNTSGTDLLGYTDLQWKRIPAFGDDLGYLRAAYTSGRMRIPEETARLCQITGCGTLKAHWFALGCDHPLAWEGEYVCEGNPEFYVDGEARPSLEYLGVEDLYDHSWGLSGTSGDGHAAILRMAHPDARRTEIAMLRCRDIDSIGFEKSLSVVLDYRCEYFAQNSTNPLHRQGVFAQRARASMDMDYQSCFYYYCKPVEGAAGHED